MIINALSAIPQPEKCGSNRWNMPFSRCLKATSTREAFVTTTITNRDFNRNVCRAKRAAASGPVIITNRGNAAYVLLAYEEYARLLRQQPEKTTDAGRRPDGNRHLPFSGFLLPLFPHENPGRTMRRPGFSLSEDSPCRPFPFVAALFVRLRPSSSRSTLLPGHEASVGKFVKIRFSSRLLQLRLPHP